MDCEDAKLLVQQALDSARSAHKRLDGLEKEVSDIHELTASIKVVNEKVDNLTDHIDEIKDDVRKVSQRPAQWWDKLVAAMIGAAGSGLVGALLTLILK